MKNIDKLKNIFSKKNKEAIKSLGIEVGRAYIKSIKKLDPRGVFIYTKEPIDNNTLNPPRG